MRIARLLLAASTAAFAFTATADAQNPALPTARDEAARLRTAVEASVTRATAAYNRGDVDGYIRDYAAEVWVFPADAEPFQGRSAANDYFGRGYAQGNRNLQLTTTGVDRSGTMAYETGTYTLDVPTPGQRGGMSRDYGKYVQIWKRDTGGAWRVHFVMWNSNLVAPAPVR